MALFGRFFLKKLPCKLVEFDALMLFVVRAILFLFHVTDKALCLILTVTIGHVVKCAFVLSVYGNMRGTTAVLR